MDELAAHLDAVQVERSVSSTLNANVRQSLYKQKRGTEQRERRDKLLRLQKSSRKEVLFKLRNIDQDEDLEKFESDLLYEDNRAMDTSSGGSEQPRKLHFKNQLMLSEWMIDIPTDFPDKWVMVQCPVGKRCLVVTSKKQTKSYSKSGARLRSFPSELPGGGPNSSGNGITWLDCIFCEAEKIFYVLDVLTWNSHPLIESDTEFRSFWATSKLADQPELSQQTQWNPYSFVPLIYHNCQRDSISGAMQTNLPYELDGLLFFHRETQYLRGTTPLAVWLKPYMIHEVLGIQVPSQYTNTQPKSYSGFNNHLSLMKSHDGLQKKHQELYAPMNNDKLSKAEHILINDAKFGISLERQLPARKPDSSVPVHDSFGHLPYQVNVQADSLLPSSDSTHSNYTGASLHHPQAACEDNPKENITDPWISYR